MKFDNKGQGAGGKGQEKGGKGQGARGKRRGQPLPNPLPWERELFPLKGGVRGSKEQGARGRRIPTAKAILLLLAPCSLPLRES